MKTTSLRARTLACALLAITAWCGLAAEPAAAQTAREHRALDGNGVDLTHGDFVMSFTEGSIGSGEAALALVRTGVWTPAASNGHEWDGVILVQDSASGPINNDVYLGTTLVPFHNSGISPDGSATLTGGGSSYVFRSADGTEINFGDPTGNSEPGSNLCNGGEGQVHCSLLPLSIASPDGRTVTIAWDSSSYCPVNGSCTYYTRIASLSNSFGYRIAFTYAGGLSGNGIPTSGWFQRTGAAFHNDNVSTTTVQASTGYSTPATGITQVTDTGGRVWRFAGTANGVTGIRRPGAASDTTSISYGMGNSVSSVTNEGVTTSYSRSVSGSVATMTVTNALSQASTVVSDLTIGRPTSVTDPLGRTTSYQYDSSARLERVTQPEGNYVHYSYDSRGNVTATTAVPKGGSGATIVASASYDSTCVNPVTCNRPNSTTDARGNTTDYTYDATHGGVLTVTGPAPTAGAVRPQTRYGYTLVNGEYRLTDISQCQTTASCAGTADEARTTLAYDANGNVTSTSSGDGSGTLTATSAMTWDALGNLLIVDGPLPGAADTGRIRYNGARQVVGTISPDPDGGGPLKHRAVRNSYTNGLLTKVEQGNVDSQSDSDWAAFTASQAVETDHDAHARPVTSRLTAGSTVYALTQTGYDALGRVECTARRMDSADFGSTLPGACSLTSPAGSFGPDRIVKTIYDAAGQATRIKVALGTADEANEVTTTYTDNGLVQAVTDAENNKTSFEHDGLDRLARIRFPVTTKGAGASSTTDYEETTYESLAGGARTSGLVSTFRNRAGETTGFGYDALSRLTAKDRPGSELDVAYGYDLLGQMTSASQTGDSLTFAWDALGRKVRQSGASGDYRSEYDFAGRRTRLTHPDGFFVDQDFLVTGELTAIRENGGFDLAALEYDQLGRREKLTLGNGDVADYGYDPVGRLETLAHDLVAGGGANDNLVTFSYNPAGQIVRRVATNPLYAWTGHADGSTSYQADGLNRLTSQQDGWGTLGFGHDARANRLNDEARTYHYDSESKSRGVAATPFHYDPLGRLSGAGNAPGTPPAIAYESYVDNLVAERTPGNSTVQRRHVFGPGMDEPLVWYEGTDRRFLSADERGSIVAVTDGSGQLLSINRYDEYGATETTSFNHGRFLYTGQRWFSGHGLYHYKNRIYDPDTGRFMQTDPIGYGAGTNLYAYVGGDPVNFTDPLGLDCYTIQERGSVEATSETDGTITKGRFYYACFHASRGPTSYFGSDGGGGGGGGGGEQDSCPAPKGKAESAAEALVAAAEVAHLGPRAVLLIPFLLTGDTPRQNVIMGGLATPENLIDRTATFSYKGQTISGFSASSAPGMSVDQLALAVGYPNGIISYTSVQDLARHGAGMIYTPIGKNRYHVTITVPAPLSRKQAIEISESLSRKPNPERCK